MIHQDIIDYFEGWSPKRLAYDWDNVGIQVGKKTDQTTGVLVTLDVLDEVISEAIEKNANLIIAHHPLLFNPLQTIQTDTPMGKIIERAIKNNITIYAAHTNFDLANQGMNDILAQQLNLKNTKAFLPLISEKQFKFVVFVPKEHVGKVRQAFHQAGAGKIGEYSHCTYAVDGVGTFKPLEGSDPYSGQVNELSEVNEIRLETIVSEQNLEKLIEDVTYAHPYEEVAYDCYPLAQPGKSYSLGRIGELTQEKPLSEVVETVKKQFKLTGLKYVGQDNKSIKKVAILGGSGEKFITNAIKAHVDLYISGDFTFHPAQIAMQNDLALIDAGHYIESNFKQAVSDYLLAQFPKLNINISTINTNPFKFSS